MNLDQNKINETRSDLNLNSTNNVNIYKRKDSECKIERKEERNRDLTDLISSPSCCYEISEFWFQNFP